MLNSEFIKDKFFERAEGTKAKLAEKCPECVVTVDDLDDKAKLEFAEMLRIVPGNLQECYLFFCRNITYYSAQK